MTFSPTPELSTAWPGLLRSERHVIPAERQAAPAAVAERASPALFGRTRAVLTPLLEAYSPRPLRCRCQRGRRSGIATAGMEGMREETTTHDSDSEAQRPSPAASEDGVRALLSQAHERLERSSNGSSRRRLVAIRAPSARPGRPSRRNCSGTWTMRNGTSFPPLPCRSQPRLAGSSTSTVGYKSN